MLLLSWYNNDISAEIQAFDEIAIVYFNMGNLEDAHHFHKRAMK